MDCAAGLAGGKALEAALQAATEPDQIFVSSEEEQETSQLLFEMAAK